MKERPTRSIILRYSLFQLPSAFLLAAVLLLLHRLTGLDGTVCWAIFLLWIAKDAVLFPLVWRAYMTGGNSAEDAMAGLTGKARTEIARRGKVEVRGEIWHAELAPGSPSVSAGSAVQVVSARGMTLLVEAVSPPPGQEPAPPPSRGRS